MIPTINKSLEQGSKPLTTTMMKYTVTVRRDIHQTFKTICYSNRKTIKEMVQLLISDYVAGRKTATVPDNASAIHALRVKLSEVAETIEALR